MRRIYFRYNKNTINGTHFYLYGIYGYYNRKVVIIIDKISTHYTEKLLQMIFSNCPGKYIIAYSSSLE
jgi:predicted nuclease of restriction endonuclease-like (RecB) superfamily